MEFQFRKICHKFLTRIDTNIIIEIFLSFILLPFIIHIMKSIKNKITKLSRIFYKAMNHRKDQELGEISLNGMNNYWNSVRNTQVSYTSCNNNL